MFYRICPDFLKILARLTNKHTPQNINECLYIEVYLIQTKPVRTFLFLWEVTGVLMSTIRVLWNWAWPFLTLSFWLMKTSRLTMMQLTKLKWQDATHSLFSVGSVPSELETFISLKSCQVFFPQTKVHFVYFLRARGILFFLSPSVIRKVHSIRPKYTQLRNKVNYLNRIESKSYIKLISYLSIKFTAIMTEFRRFSGSSKKRVFFLIITLGNSKNGFHIYRPKAACIW